MGRRIDNLDYKVPELTDYGIGYDPAQKGIRFTFADLATLVGSGGGGSGTVTSVQVSGGTTGLSFSGGPITASGTITLSVSNASTFRTAIGLGDSATKNVGTSAGTVAAGDHTHSTYTGDYIILRNATTGTYWKLEMIGATDAETEPKWTPQ